MADLIYDTESTLAIDQHKLIEHGKWQFSVEFTEMDGGLARHFAWLSKVIEHPMHKDLVDQAQQHLDDIGDNHHLYLEGFKINRGYRRIEIILGS